MKEFKTDSFVVYLLCFFILGLFNNLGYVLVWVSSSDLSNSLNSPNLVSLYLLVMQVIGSLTRFSHMKFCIKLGYRIKFFIVAIGNFIGYLSFYFILKTTNFDNPDSLKTAFYLSLIPTTIIGAMCSLGEVTCVGYLKKFPSTWIAGFTSGTGLAGVLGALIKIIFVLSKVKTSLMWLIMSFTGILYFLAYIFSERIHKKDLKNNHEQENLITMSVPLEEKQQKKSVDSESNVKLTDEKINNDIKENSNENSDDPNALSTDDDNDNKSVIEVISEAINSKENNKNKELNWENLKKGISLAGFYIINIGLGYFFSYNIIHFTERYDSYKYIDTKNVSFKNVIIF